MGQHLGTTMKRHGVRDAASGHGSHRRGAAGARSASRARRAATSETPPQGTDGGEARRREQLLRLAAVAKRGASIAAAILKASACAIAADAAFVGGRSAVAFARIDEVIVAPLPSECSRAPAGPSDEIEAVGSLRGGATRQPEKTDDEILAELRDASDPSRRTDPYPWEGLNTKWMTDPSVSVVLPPDDRDGHQYLLEVKRDEMTGEELRGTLDLELKKTKGGKVDAKALQKKYKDKLLVQTAFRPDKLREMTYSQFWCLVEEGRIQKAKFSIDRRNLFVTTKPEAPGGRRTEKIGLPPDPDLMDHLTAHGVFVEEPGELSAIENALLGFMRIGIPAAVGLALLYSCSKIGMLAEDKTSSFEVVAPREVGTTFNDVAGIDTIKGEVQEVVTFLQHPKRFLEMGIRTPSGVLLVGLPGTGKTLLARAVAAEANVPLINCSGAEFVDEYVGMGAAKIRDLFELAREKAPCVVFIDEFDGLGKARTGGAGSEDMHTCNQLLAEMDGFTNNTGVVILAATNRAFVLDRAVLRPGRFDRLLEMPLPNREGRLAILRVHARGKRMGKNVDLGIIAKATPGFTGAELANLVNMGGLTAIRRGREVISQEDLFESLDEVQAERTGEANPFAPAQIEGQAPAELRRRMAAFATAKGLVGCSVGGYHELARVSVNPSGLASTFAHFIPKEESVETNVLDRATLEKELVVLMAGYCGEKRVYGEDSVSVLGNSDWEQANALAHQMVCEYGYGDKVGSMVMPAGGAGEAGGAGGGESRQMRAWVADDVAKMLADAEERSARILEDKADVYARLTERLFVEQTIVGEDFKTALGVGG